MLRVENIGVSGTAHLDLVKSIVGGNLEVEKWTARDESRLFAAIEWIIPAAVIIIITKSALEGFFKEFGSVAGKSAIKAFGDTIDYVKRKIDPRAYSSHDLRSVAERMEKDGKLEKLPGDYDDLGKKLSLLSMRVTYDQDGIECAVNLIFAHDCDSQSVQIAMLEFDKIRNRIYQLVNEHCSKIKQRPDLPRSVNVNLVFRGDQLGWRLVEGREMNLVSH